jgi:nitroreductase
MSEAGMTERSLFERRFSCRPFTDTTVHRDQLERLLEAAVWAPSGGNLQPWRFVIVLDAGRRRDLAAAAHGQSFVAETAPARSRRPLDEVCVWLG